MSSDDGDDVGGGVDQCTLFGFARVGTCQRRKLMWLWWWWCDNGVYFGKGDDSYDTCNDMLVVMATNALCLVFQRLVLACVASCNVVVIAMIVVVVMIACVWKI